MIHPAFQLCYSKQDPFWELKTICKISTISWRSSLSRNEISVLKCAHTKILSCYCLLPSEATFVIRTKKGICTSPQRRFFFFVTISFPSWLYGLVTEIQYTLSLKLDDWVVVLETVMSFKMLIPNWPKTYKMFYPINIHAK